MQATQIFARHRKHAERIGVAQIRFGRERKAREVGERPDRVRPDFGGLPFSAVVGHVGIGALQSVLETRRLQNAQRLARHCFRVGVEHENARIRSCRLRAHGRLSLSLTLALLIASNKRAHSLARRLQGIPRHAEAPD